MEKTVLLETKSLVDSICRLIQDSGRVFFECRNRSMRSRFPPSTALNKLGTLHRFLVIIIGVAGRFVLLGDEVSEFNFRKI